MRTNISARTSWLPALLLLFSVAPIRGQEKAPEPWQTAGLDEPRAVAHALDRFAYGARPGQVDAVLDQGLRSWLEGQLEGGESLNAPEHDVDRRLREARSLHLDARESAALYPDPGQVLRMADREGVVEREKLENLRQSFQDAKGDSRQETRREVMEFAEEQGFRSQRELVGELMVNKLVRAVYSEHQLREVLTDFWFNHFNVSITDNDARVYISAFEREAIRPHVLGNFHDLLVATAKHPAMLFYLDNAQSVAEDAATTTVEARLPPNRRGRERRLTGNRDDFGLQGLNENYARELLELHTLGVDGGYTQDDVLEVARAFTGWAALPPGPLRPELERRLERARQFSRAGFVVEGAFIFRANAHDAESKTVLGHRLAPGRGIEDGLEVLDLLAKHPSTARHIAHKLAVRFVSDEPPQSLVDRLAQRFLDTEGNLEEVMRCLLDSPETWSPEVLRAKIKSPFEVAVSALRTLDVDLRGPRPMLEWIQRMGQPLYAYQAPTGFPDRAEAWVNTGALLHRMNFGLDLATGRIAGLRLDLPALNGGREPESVDAALGTYVPLLLPERDPAETLDRLRPVVRNPQLASKVAAAAPASETTDDLFGPEEQGLNSEERGRWRRLNDRYSWPPPRIDDSPLAQVVGVILGSPEFQRR